MISATTVCGRLMRSNTGAGSGVFTLLLQRF